MLILFLNKVINDQFDIEVIINLKSLFDLLFNLSLVIPVPLVSFLLRYVELLSNLLSIFNSPV